MRLPPLGHGEGAHCWPHSLLTPVLNHHGGTRTPRGRGTSLRLLDDDPKKETPPSGSQTAGHTAWELPRRTPRNQGGEWEGKVVRVRRARPRPRDTACEDKALSRQPGCAHFPRSGCGCAAHAETRCDRSHGDSTNVLTPRPLHLTSGVPEDRELRKLYFSDSSAVKTSE